MINVIQQTQELLMHALNLWRNLDAKEREKICDLAIRLQCHHDPVFRHLSVVLAVGICVCTMNDTSTRAELN